MPLKRFSLALTTAFLAAFAAPAWAQVPLSGYFIAQDTCPAFQSFRNQTNPGDIATEMSRAYELVGANKADASHYWIVIPGVEPDHRWVAVNCGVRAETVAGGGQVQTPPRPIPDDDAPTPLPAGQTQYILAVSWQPAFCETRPNKPECESQTEDRFDASHFTLHGLWPQPRSNAYCNVTADEEAASADSRWDDLPTVELSQDLRQELDKVMPGTQSNLERHEWTKHGTCYDTDEEEYFADSLAMMSALNTSAVAELFASNVGKQVTQAQVRAAVNESFGEGAGERVRLACPRDGGRTLIGELTIGLTGEITAPEDFSTLILAARPTDGGCDAGIVDPVGLQ